MNDGPALDIFDGLELPETPRRKPGRAPGLPRVPGSGRAKGTGNHVPAELRARIGDAPLLGLLSIALGERQIDGHEIVKDKDGRPKCVPKYSYPRLELRERALEKLSDKVLPDLKSSELVADVKTEASVTVSDETLRPLDVAHRLAFIVRNALSPETQKLLDVTPSPADGDDDAQLDDADADDEADDEEGDEPEDDAASDDPPERMDARADTPAQQASQGGLTRLESQPLGLHSVAKNFEKPKAPVDLITSRDTTFGETVGGNGRGVIALHQCNIYGIWFLVRASDGQVIGTSLSLPAARAEAFRIVEQGGP